MNKILCILLLISIAYSATTSTTECKCQELLSKTDCQKRTSLGCSWDETKNTCSKSIVTPPVTTSYASYCQSFSQTECFKTNGCLWNTDKCTHFTGCTAFNKTTDLECQAISTKCITDGTHCVEKGECKSFLKQVPCVVNANNKDCFWDSTANSCIDASLCEHYPKTLTTDAECRAKNVKCTVKTGGGCQNSATSCATQEGEQQCVYGDQIQKQKCFWKGSECVNRTCDQAPASYKTHDQCNKSYDENCTTNGEGCRTISSCTDAKVAEGCKINSSKELCYWTGTTCLNYNCDAAPISKNTIPLCENFKSGCVPKKDGGCKEIGACNTLDEIACVKNKAGGLCIFNGTCKDKTCTNAPANNTTHEACSTYMETCTVNSTNNGCRDRECINAPSTINSLSDCEKYKSKCIPKKQGGCQNNTTCDKIDLQVACTNDGYGSLCTWDATLEKCLDKTCANAPAEKRTSHALCQSYSNKCTVNSAKNSCIDLICENIVESADCLTDSYGLKCKYKGSCYFQECRLASQTITTHAGCQSFMNTCTLDNSNKGCMPIPPNCSAIGTQEGCVQNSSNNECAWASNKCQEKSCSTAPTSTTDNSLCNTYKTNCLVNNTANGCIDPQTYACTSRQTVDNCYSSVGLKCVYSSTKKCYARSCESASDSTITSPSSNGYLTTFDHNNCNTYLQGCILNNAGTGCRSLATSCTDYNEKNCDKPKIDGKGCYLNNDNTCVELICEKIKLQTHNACENVSGTLKTCTVGKGASPTTCMTKYDTCQQFEENQCKSTKSGKNCIWQNKVCREAICSDASDSGSFVKHTDCNTFVSTCTVIERVQKQGCMPKKANCSDYTSEAQCEVNLNGVDCYWNGNNTCVTLSTLTCAQIVLSSYNDVNCETVKYSCKADSNTACKIKACSDYVKTDGTSTGLTDVTTDSECKDLDGTCTINNASPKKACMTRPATCTGTDSTLCTFSDAGVCQFNGSACVLKSTLCSSKIGTNLTFSQCQNFNSSCSVNLGGTACVDIKASCTGYTTLSDCRKATEGFCKIDSGACALEATVVCSQIVKTTGVLLTYSVCQDFSNSCSVKADGSACIDIGQCSSYTTALGVDCSKGSDATCFWNNACVPIAAGTDCSKVIASSLTDDKCSNYNSECYANSDSSACFQKKTNCQDYTDQKNCLKTSGGAKCYWYTSGGTSTCIQISTSSTDCAKVLKSQLGGVATSDSICKAYNSECVTNIDTTGCIQVKALCTGYSTSNDCVSTSGGAKCFWYAPNGGTPSCIQISTSADCSKVTGSSLTFNGCQAYNTACSVNSGQTACEAKSCTNKPTTFTHSACSSYLQTCTANKASGATACKQAPNKCLDVTAQADCIGSVVDGECEWIAGSVSGQCVKKTCYTKISSIALSHSTCESYLNSCTVAKVGGCIPKSTCNTYLSQDQCQNVGNCFWNSKQTMTCVDFSCDKIEDAYNTHGLCHGIANLNCTVKSTGLGCQNKSTSCSSYNDKNCYLNSANQECVMVPQADGSNKCMEKACTTAGSSYTDHNGCYDYFKSNSNKSSEQCTVAIVTATDGTSSASGCQKVSACTDYKQSQCYVDSEGKTCVWDDTAGCRIKSCQTAPDNDSYDSDDECKAYLVDGSCTVASDDMGCVERPEKCEGMTEKQCVKDKAGNQCQYLNGACFTKSCSTAPSDIDTKDECIAYFPGCTMDETNKCKLEICEDFIFVTDSDCEKAKPGCTTNGTKCVLRTSCQAVTNKAGCVTELLKGGAQGKCQWVTSTNTCVSRSCSTAPISTDYDTDAECKEYLPGCTTKNGGGCVPKSTCSAATAESACAADDINQNKCTWDNGKCRDQGCQDFSFSTHLECKKASTKLNCTAGLNGKCTNQSTCEAAQVRAACIEGIYNSGPQPCLWIQGANSGNGGCFAYTSCNSRTWQTHAECQWISSQCTTNGQNCLAISQCSETNTSGGCKVGYDGPCIQTVPTLGSNDAAVCKAYTSCADAFYKTHTDCNTASNKCTTNGATSCAPLGACTSYTIKEACVINNVGEVADPSTSVITSTGKCTWENGACRDQVCKDLNGTTHLQCSNALKGCTSDGTNCISIALCASYTTKQICETAIGSDGPSGKCLWDSTANNNAGACRVYQCSDITGGISTAICQAGLSSCVSNGTICIDQANCNSASYQNKISCNSAGKDGICVFTKSTAAGATENQGTCALMTSCDSAKNDSKACTDAKSRCAWTPQSTSGTTTVASKCTAHTCATNKQTNQICSNFPSWDFKTQQVCVIDGIDCKEKDPATLSQDLCYTSSGYTYTWSTAASKCGVCTEVKQDNNTTTNPNTTTPNNTDDSGYILGFTTVILGYLVF